jgi:hypothetical protein
MPRHSTRISEAALISHFSFLMQDALELNRDSKSHWLECDKEDLIDGIERNFDDLCDELRANPDKAEVRKRCANIANFAAMIADRYKE